MSVQIPELTFALACITAEASDDISATVLTQQTKLPISGTARLVVKREVDHSSFLNLLPHLFQPNFIDAIFQFLCELDLPIKTKLETLAKEIYGAYDISYAATANRQIRNYERNGFGNRPVGIAKTHQNLSHKTCNICNINEPPDDGLRICACFTFGAKCDNSEFRLFHKINYPGIKGKSQSHSRDKTHYADT